MNDIHKKQTEKLADEGLECIRNADYERALEISSELEERRYSAAFDIGAQAHAGLGDYENAVTLLRRGLELAPQVWLNWQLLGNYLSDLNKYDDAKNAYNRALECESAWKDSVYLNQAILANRMNEPSNVLNILETIIDEDLQLDKIEVQISALIELDRLDDAVNLANKVLSTEQYAEKDEDVVGRIAAHLGQIYLKQGKSKLEVRVFALHSLSYAPNNRMILALIRDIDNRYSSDAHYYQALIHCIVSIKSPDYEDIKGYYCEYDVIASSIDELLSYVKQFEEGVVQDGNYSVDKYEVLEENTKDPCGVYSIRGRAFYENED